MEATERRDGASLFVSPDMMGSLVGLAVTGISTLVNAYFAFTSSVVSNVVVVLMPLSLIGFMVLLIYVRARVGRVRKLREEIGTLKKEHSEALARATAESLRDLAQARSEKNAAQSGAAEMLDSLQWMVSAVQQLGLHPDRDAALDVIAKGVRLASRALSTFIVGGGQIVVCAKRLVLKEGDVAWATRLAIWPSYEGDNEFPISASRPLDKLVKNRLPYYYVSNTDEFPGFQRHVQFAARTILVTPIAVQPGRGIGFLWISSELPVAFDAGAVLSYAKALGIILAPLFSDEYAKISSPQSGVQTEPRKRLKERRI